MDTCETAGFGKAEKKCERASETASESNALQAEFLQAAFDGKAGAQRDVADLALDAKSIPAPPPWKPDPICTPFDPFCRPDPVPMPWDPPKPPAPPPHRHKRY